MKYKKLSDVYQIHKGETIYLIGNGPDLLNIPEEYYENIKNGISIGANTSHLFMPTTYQACSSWSSYILNCNYGVVTGCRFYHGQGMGNDSSYPWGGATTLEPSFFEENNTIYTAHHAVNPINRSIQDALFENPHENGQIFGAINTIFALINLATIMGAAKIVFLGCDHKLPGHYYDHYILMGLLQGQKDEMLKKYSADPYIVSDLQEMTTYNIDKTEIPPYLKTNDNAEPLKAMISCMKENGVEPIVHTKNSLVYESGATLKELW